MHCASLISVTNTDVKTINGDVKHIVYEKLRFFEASRSQQVELRDRSMVTTDHLIGSRKWIQSP